MAHIQQGRQISHMYCFFSSAMDMLCNIILVSSFNLLKKYVSKYDVAYVCGFWRLNSSFDPECEPIYSN